MRTLSGTNKAEAAAIREELRQAGKAALGCNSMRCVYYSVCGGTSAVGQFDCFACRGDDCSGCDFTCPYTTAGTFVGRMRDVGGLAMGDLAHRYRQPKLVIPKYIPTILHQYKRIGLLGTPIVAVPLYRLFRKVHGEYRTVVEGPCELREHFRLQQGTRIVLRGVDKDQPLETYWRYRRKHRAATQLARLGVTAVIAPNYSHFLNAPRTHNLHNRKRQLICISELADAGITVVPHISASHQSDWRFWREFLRANPGVHIVASEFQTGNKSPKEGLKALKHLRWLQDEIGHSLWPILIGGSRFAATAGQAFERISVMDSQPFSKAMRRWIRTDSGWVFAPTMEWAPLDDYLATNIAKYTTYIEQLILDGRQKRPSYVA